MELIECGKIVNIHGVRGFVKVMPWCDSVQFLLSFEKLFLEDGTVLNVEDAFEHKGGAIMKFDKVKDADEAQRLRGAVLYIDKASVALDKGTYFIKDLIGLKVIDLSSGDFAGEVCDVLDSMAQDVYVIKNGDKTYMVPAVKEFIKEVDLETKTIKIMPIRGLLSDED